MKYHYRLFTWFLPILLLLSIVFIIGCDFLQSKQQTNKENTAKSVSEIDNNTIDKVKAVEAESKRVAEIELVEFDRSESQKRITEKIENKIPLIVHVLVPLCDNENQGIVSVNANLGNGLNLRTNLYWGSKYGIKNHFKVLKGWKLVQTESNTNKNILERAVFKKILPNKTTVYLIADAYRGDKMEACLEDYLQAISGRKQEDIAIKNNSANPNNTPIGIYSNADLIVFNGHNGLMDHTLDFQNSQDNQIRETAVIGCISHRYFKEHLLHSKGYPILMTTNLMAPEGYVLEGLINAWIDQKSGAEIRKNVGKAYHQYQKCGINGATRLFKTGW